MVGVDPRRTLSIRHLPRFLAERRRFVGWGGKISHTHATLDDYREQAGSASGHYFHQDLLVASAIYRADPARHIDVGSRNDGFAAHVAAFRLIEIIDIRPLSGSLPHKNISFMRGDLMNVGGSEWDSICDSLSCLHALEHFGLGRYGDPIDPDGHLRGFKNLHRLLKPGGTLYLSFPVSASDTEVHFNAHRVFRVSEPLEWAAGRFRLERFDFVDDQGAAHLDTKVEAIPLDTRFGCGIYTLIKL